MKVPDIARRVIELLSEVQDLSGRKNIALDGGSRPIGDLPGFDSLNAVETTVMICSDFGIAFPHTNIFVNDSGTRTRTVSQVATCISTLLKN